MGLRIKRVIGLLVAFTLVIGAAGCGSKVVAKVNNDSITQNQFDKMMNKQIELMKQQGAAIKKDPKDQMYQALQKQTLDGMVDDLLILQAAQKQGVKASDKEVKAKLDEIKKSFNSDKLYKDTLKQQGFTEADLKDYIMQQLTANNLFNKVTKDSKVTDDEVKKYYEDHKSDMAQKQSVKLRYILAQTEKDADTILSDVNSGKDFAQEAKDKSQDSNTKAAGGLLVDQSGNEYSTQDGITTYLGKEVGDAAFAMKNGEVKKVKGQAGFYVIKVEDTKSAKDFTLEEAKKELKLTDQVLQSKKQDKFNQYFADFKKKASIKKYLKTS